MGGMMLMGSTANINTGRRHPQWHIFCATRFFIFTVLALIYNSILYCIIYIKIRTISLINLKCKLALLTAMLVQLLINV